VFMSAREALQAALRSEEKAHAFFVRALPRLEDSEVRALFEELRDEEVEHQRLVKVELSKLPPEAGFDPDDFADEPVAH
jgi:rubrerythrin